MDCGRRRFVQIVLANPAIRAILAGAPELGLEDWWLTGGALFQSVWNALSGRVLTAGISDYDLFYFDASDRSWEAENAVIGRAARAFAQLGAPVQVRNEARVHLWYPARFGVTATPFIDSRDAIDHFASTSAFGVTRRADGELAVHAPYGYADPFTLTVRPNPRLAPRAVYEAKAGRWQREWPALTVLPWTDRSPPLIDAGREDAADSARTRRSRDRRPPA